MTDPRDEILALSGASRWGRHASAARADAWRLAAFLPPVAAIVPSGIWLAPAFDLMHLAVAVIGAQALFAWVRGRSMPTGGLATALALALLLPAGTPVLHLMLGAVFGAVLGELIFGGRGHSFLNPAVVGLAFVHFSLPGAGLPAAELPLAAAALGAGVLLAAGLSDWRIVLAALVPLGLAGAASEAVVWPWTGTAVFVVAFLAADIASVPAARAARWVTGLLLAGLALLLEPGGGLPGPRALIFAALLTAVFAPLIDSAVLAIRETLPRRRRSS